MLKNLLKYDIKRKYNVLLIFYALGIFFALLTRIFLNIDNSFILSIVGKILSGCTIALIVNIIINNTIRFLVVFKKDFYGDESYLNHTLPVTKKELYLSKFLVTILYLFISTIVITFILFIAYYSKENINIIKDLLLPLSNLLDSSVISIILTILFVMFLELLVMIECGYTGIITGNMSNNYKTGKSVIYGLLTYGIVQVGILLLLFISGLFNSNIMDLFFTNEITNIDTLKTILYLVIVMYSIFVIVLHFVNIKFFNKGVNVE